MALTFSALTVLAWLTRQGDGAYSVPDEICDRSEQADVHDELVAQSLLLRDGRMAGDPTFGIAPTSRGIARREARRHRQAALQLQVMSRIEEAPVQGGTEDYLPPSDVLGEPVEEREFNRAVAQLQEWDLIKGVQGPGSTLLRPELTLKGYQVFESGFAPEDWLSTQTSPSSSVTHIGDKNTVSSAGPVGSIQQGHGNEAQVTQNVGFDLEAFTIAMQKIHMLVREASISDDDREAAEAQLELIEEQANNSAPASKIKGLFRILVNALPAALASEITTLTSDALSSLAN